MGSYLAVPVNMAATKPSAAVPIDLPEIFSLGDSIWMDGMLLVQNMGI
jgi:hypothetical protein